MKCAINPKTNKPYSKHKLVNDQRLVGYTPGVFGSAIWDFSITHCTRDGCKR